jgi:drug/metabolite transporter (DMT)-like permease
MPSRLLLYSKVTFAVLVWGASFIATKVALQEVAPVTVVWLRFLMGVLVLLLAVGLRGQLALPAASDLAYFALLGFIGITFHQWLQSTGLVTAQASTTAWIVATTPVFMALLGWLVLREKLTPLQAGGILLAALGVLLVVTGGDVAGMFAGRSGTIGDLLILISAPNWAVFSVLSRRGLRLHPAGRMMLFVMSFGWLFSSVLFFSGPGLADIANLSLSGWSAVAFLGIACSGLAYIFWYDALQVLPSARVGAFLYLEPLAAVAVAAAVLGEPVLFVSLAGGAVILLGVWMVNKRRWRTPAGASSTAEPPLPGRLPRRSGRRPG